MKKGIIWIILAAVLVAVLAGAGILYSRLSVQIDPGVPPVSEVRESAETASQADEASAGQNETATAEAETAKTMAEDFMVLNAQGQEETLSEHFGKPIIVNFWATWCGFCVEELPAFNAAAEKYGDRIDFMMVDLTDGERETVEVARAFVADSKFTFPVYFDTMENAATAYGVFSIPLTLFIAADGTVQDSRLGAMTEDELERNIAALLG